MRTPKHRKDKNERWAGRNWPEWPERFPRGGSPKRKNTKKFCRGKPGVVHTFKEELILDFAGSKMYQEKCTNCGKHGKYRFERKK